MPGDMAARPMSDNTQPPTTSERDFEKDLGSLAAVFAHLDEALADAKLDGRGHFALQLAVEELFTNMIKYGSGHGRVSVRIAANSDSVRVELVDPDTEPFDPTSFPSVDTTRPIEERKRGGLGLHLIRSMMDGFEYSYRGREMTVSITKYLE